MNMHEHDKYLYVLCSGVKGRHGESADEGERMEAERTRIYEHKFCRKREVMEDRW